MASRYYQKNLDLFVLNKLFEAVEKNKLTDSVIHTIIDDFKDINWILPPTVSENKDIYDDVLYKLFTLIIKHGARDLMQDMKHDDTITASNYLKKDTNYINILRINWDDISEGINSIFSDIEK